MFKKPKRNLRTRQADSDTEEDAQDRPTTVEPPTLGPGVVKKPALATNGGKVNKDSKKVQLSFQHDEEEVEEFKIKKSSHSRKIVMQLKQESLKEKESKQTVEKKNVFVSKQVQPKPAEKKAEIQRPADTVAMDVGSDDSRSSYSDSDTETSNGSQKDPSKVAMRRVLESGQIPDSKLIHMMKKQREMARLKGSEDFIPIDDTVRSKPSTGRLIREEDEDLSEDEERRWDFSQVKNQREKELRHMNSTILAAEHGSDEEDSDQEARAWEEQQIRKGVSIPAQQVATAQSLSHSSSSQQLTSEYPSYNDLMSASYYLTMQQQQQQQPMMYSAMPTSSSSSSLASIAATGRFSGQLPPAQLPQVTIDDVVARLQQRLNEMMDVYRVHVHERDDIESRMEASQARIEALTGDSGGLEERYRYFHEMRGYVQDVIECFAEKIVSINYLERCMDKLLLQRTEKLAKRRQEDVKDQAQDYMPSKAVALTPQVDSELKQRRVAEREARRTRRRRAREGTPAASSHQEGLSTDDEENNSETIKFTSERDRIVNDSRTVFDDVVEDFVDTELICKRFAQWRSEHNDSYTEAYISLCVSKLVVPLVRHSLITWNPLQKSSEDIENMAWFKALVRYSMQYGETDVNKLLNDDKKILPSIVEKVLLAKITSVAEKAWNVTSLRETQRLVSAVKWLINDCPSITADSKPTQATLKAIVQVLRKALDEELFIPIYPRDVIENQTTGAGAFFHRRFWTAVKLMAVVLQWQDVISPRLVQEMALDRILNRYLVLALQNCPVGQDSLIKCQAIVDLLPSDWFTGDKTIPQLEPLCRYLMFAASTLDKSADKTMSKESIRQFAKSVIRMLTKIHALDHVLNLAKFYSIKL